jgi:hypothetical protein
MAGQMRWRRDDNGDMQLQLKSDVLSPWRSYRGHTNSVPDHAAMSPGYPTFVHLLKQGWEALGKEE